MRQRGFTLLEVLVATLIMGIAVVGLLSGISTSLRNADRLSEAGRASLLAKRKMEELLLDTRLPRFQTVEEAWDPADTGGVRAGWRALLTPYDVPPGAGPGTPVLERIQLEVWWMRGGQRRTLTLEGFRRGLLAPSDFIAGVLRQ